MFNYLECLAKSTDCTAIFATRMQELSLRKRYKQALQNRNRGQSIQYAHAEEAGNAIRKQQVDSMLNAAGSAATST